MALTPKQEAFCREYVGNGGNATQAYLTAYDSKSPVSAAQEGYRLLQSDDVQVYLKSLNKPLEEAARTKALTARDEQIAFIRERIAICKQKEDEQSIIRYTDMLNKINALYKDNEPEQKQTSPIGNLDMDALRKLTQAP